VDEASAWGDITQALTQAGFVRDWGRTSRPTWAGKLDPHGLAADAEVEVVDLDFLSAPVMRVLQPERWGREIAHVLRSDGQLCYMDLRAQVLDRYIPGRTVMACVRAAEEVLRDAVAGKSDAYFLDDFAAYWGGDAMYVDLPEDAKTGEIAWVALNPPPTPKSGLLTTKGKLDRAFEQRHEIAMGKDATPEREACPILTVSGPLRVDPQLAWPPRTLGDFLTWLDSVAPGVTAQLDRRFDEGEGAHRMFGLRATNGLFIVAIDIPKGLQRQEFLENRRTRLLRNIKAAAGSNSAITRISTLRIDPAYVYGRNLVKPPGLAGRRIALIGCGSIGGFLAELMVRSGAGSQGGCLTLFDPDRLQPANLGRHALPIAALNLNKAEAMRQHLQNETAHLDIGAVEIDALTRLNQLRDQDLIIDATGEEAFSIALNHRVVAAQARFPPCLHVWLEGNGDAGVGLLRDAGSGACYKCLKPDLAAAPRHRVMRPGAEPELRQNYACGDPLFVPYPISRAVEAAALALDMALDWAGGDPSPRHRARSFAPERTFQVKAGDPGPAKTCPACSRSS
jgi:hypothetical protein